MSSSLLHPRRLAPAVATLVACLCATAGSAHAAGCTPSYSVITRVLTIDACFSDPDAPTVASISRTAAGAIQLDGQPIAGGPTVTNTDKIVYHGEDGNGDDITLDMSNGLFAPGFSSDQDGGSMEIEIEIDGGSGGGSDNFLTILGRDSGGDRIDVGAAGIDLNQDGDSDIMRTNLSGSLTIDGQGGADWLSGTGFTGYADSTAPLTLRGGAGDDLIRGGAGSDHLSGGAGEDTVSDMGSGGFVLTAASLTGNGTDTLAGFERAALTGSPASETIDASAFTGVVGIGARGGDDHLIGGPHDDSLQGDAGDDQIQGGPGSDRLIEQVENTAVLSDTSMTGLGSDSLDSIERADLHGRPTDNRIDASGFSGSADLRGGDGNDTLVGGPGPDVFDAGTGDDRILSRDELSEPVDCGDGADMAVTDVLDGLTGCEQIDRGDAPPVPGGTGAQGGTGGADAGGADAIAPALTGLTLSRRAFHAARSGAALAAASTGTVVRFTLSERARVTFRIERSAPGRRYVRLRGKLVHAGAQGANGIVLRGRLGRRALRPGRYRLVARATDAAGNRSGFRRANFRILAP